MVAYLLGICGLYGAAMWAQFHALWVILDDDHWAGVRWTFFAWWMYVLALVLSKFAEKYHKERRPHDLQ